MARFSLHHLLAFFCLLSVVLSERPSEDGFSDWLQHMSDTSSDVSKESLIAARETSIQSADFQLNGGSEQKVSGFDAWLEKKKLLKSTATKSQFSKKKIEDKDTIYVAQDGSGNFKTITDALNSIPQENSHRKVIFIKAGTYYERFVIPDTQKYIALVGEGADKTIISGDATAGDQVGDEILRTFRSCTVGVNSDHFIAKDLLIQNTAPAPQPGAVLQQAVALRLSGDKAALYDVAVLGAQDTLYDHKGRHAFYGCFIQGSIDFIFGNGRSYYKDCHLHSIAQTFGSLTAQKKNETTQNTGFSFVNNVIDGTGIIYLGRAWGNYSRVVYAWSWLGEMITPEGWQDWGIPQRDFEVYYGQYQCSGPGANTEGRVWYAKQLDEEQAKPFLTDAFVNGHSWIEDGNDY